MTVLLAGVLMVGTSSANAMERHHSNGNSNTATVEGNNVVAISNSGLNGQEQYAGSEHNQGRTTQDQWMETGNAHATASQDNVLNSTDGCGCSTRRGNTTRNEATVQDNNVVALANSGLNHQEQNAGSAQTLEIRSRHHSSRGGNTTSQTQDMVTGNASAEAAQWNTLNSSVSN